MLKLVFSALALLLLVSCGGNDTDEVTVAPGVQIEKFLADNNLTGETTTSAGLVYIIEDEGQTARPERSSVVTINYKGYTPDGEVFDETDGSPRTFGLSNLIAAWQEALPLIGRGGKIKILAPPSIAYGNSPPASIPRGAVLVFDIELIDFR